MSQVLKSLFYQRKVLIFGLGLQGGGVADALTALSFGAKVRVTDLKTATQLQSSLAKLPSQIETSLRGHKPEDIEWADLIIQNPAVPFDQPLIQLAHQLKKPVYGSAALYLQTTSLPVIGITGTRGKSTTTNLIYYLLNHFYPNKVLLGGNLPDKSPLQLINQEQDKRYAVLELSSFQLHFCHSLKVSPHLAVVTNIYPDHLNRYPDMETYIQDKLALVKYQQKSDHAILNQNDSYSSLFARNTSAQVHYFTYANLKTSLIGSHNQANLAAALKVAEILNLPLSKTKEILSQFRGLPFRLERVGEKRGITFINDTTSTTPIATITAIKAMSQPFVLIVGGSSKNLPLNDLIKTICKTSSLKKIVILGSYQNPEFVQQLYQTCPQKIIAQVKSMQAAVSLAFKHAQSSKIKTVLLSPGFASFDLFKNEFDRGRQFNELVAKL